MNLRARDIGDIISEVKDDSSVSRSSRNRPESKLSSNKKKETFKFDIDEEK